METVPVYLSLVFALTTALGVGIFYLAANASRPTLAVLLGWLLLQGALASSGFYAVPTGVPPRLLFALGPPLLVILALMTTQRGQAYVDGLRLPVLTLLHTIRIPVELVLLGLFTYHAIPKLMTFEGRNWDILSGLTAPLVYYLVFRRQVLGTKALLWWNVLCLGLVLNIAGNALLAVPGPLQRFAFDQPNVAITHFPFIWLPSCLVPLVILSHLAAIRQLARTNGVRP